MQRLRLLKVFFACEPVTSGLAGIFLSLVFIPYALVAEWCYSSRIIMGVLGNCAR